MAISPHIGPGKFFRAHTVPARTSRSRATAHHALYLKQTPSLITYCRALRCPKTLGKECIAKVNLPSEAREQQDAVKHGPRHKLPPLPFLRMHVALPAARI